MDFSKGRGTHLRLKWDSLNATNYPKVADFEGEPVTLTITEVVRDEVQMVNGTKAEKYIVRFDETEMELIPNRTNATGSGGSQSYQLIRQRPSDSSRPSVRDSGRSWIVWVELQQTG